MALPIMLSACSGVPVLWSDPEPQAMQVRQVGALRDCASPQEGARVQLFESGEAARAWAASRQRDRLVRDVRPGRPYVVIELGTASSLGSGIAVRSQAERIGKRVRLEASLFQGDAATAPCVVVALPPGIDASHTVAVYDAGGQRIAASQP
ncbi:hypothetical protein [Algiphilus sp.]|uniref:hypothetical protein n=1 Tax=Algiphilus sp. TaxID=1872431 RepID=UPI003B52093C